MYVPVAVSGYSSRRNSILRSCILILNLQYRDLWTIYAQDENAEWKMKLCCPSSSLGFHRKKSCMPFLLASDCKKS